jgi:hypothetical protein
MTRSRPSLAARTSSSRTEGVTKPVAPFFYPDLLPGCSLRMGRQSSRINEPRSGDCVDRFKGVGSGSEVARRGGPRTGSHVKRYDGHSSADSWRRTAMRSLRFQATGRCPHSACCRCRSFPRLRNYDGRASRMSFSVAKLASISRLMARWTSGSASLKKPPGSPSMTMLIRAPAPSGS